MPSRSRHEALAVSAPAGTEHIAPALGGHAGPETMPPRSCNPAGLVCTFHLRLSPLPHPTGAFRSLTPPPQDQRFLCYPILPAGSGKLVPARRYVKSGGASRVLEPDVSTSESHSIRFYRLNASPSYSYAPAPVWTTVWRTFLPNDRKRISSPWNLTRRRL